MRLRITTTVALTTVATPKQAAMAALFHAFEPIEMEEIVQYHRQMTRIPSNCRVTDGLKIKDSHLSSSKNVCG